MIEKSSYPILFISLLGCFVFYCSKTNSTKKIATFPELTNPYQHIWADKDQLFISDGKGPEDKKTTIHVYSLKDFSFQANFGGSGEEPEKFLVTPDHSVTLIVEPNRLIVGSGGRVSFFTRDGEFKSELKHNRDSFFYHPVGEMFIGRQGIRENNIDYYTVNGESLWLRFKKTKGSLSYRKSMPTFHQKEPYIHICSLFPTVQKPYLYKRRERRICHGCVRRQWQTYPNH